MAIELASLTNDPVKKVGDFVRHPTTGAPYVNHPTEVTARGVPRRVMYGRPSGFGVDNPYSLIKWKERKLLEGVAELDIDWSTVDFTDRNIIDQLVNAAYQAAGSSLAADRGTHIHLLCEAIDRDDLTGLPLLLANGVDLGIPALLQEQIAGQWIVFRAALGVTALAVEATVVHDGWQLAGTLDRLDQTTKPIDTTLGRIPKGKAFIGDIKGLALDTPIPTPTGWTTIRAVKVGDQVIGRDGRPCNVVGKSDVRFRPCYRIRFADGTAVIADDEHCWTVESGELARPRRTYQVLTTREIVGSLVGQYGQRQHRIVNPEPLELPTADLLLDPYVFGIWLGDGKHTSGEISKPIDSGIWDEIRARGFKLGKTYIDKRTGCATHTVLGMLTTLRRLDQHANKHVPDAYLRGSLEQRLDLLRGLMDTDGCWNIARNRATFCSTDKRFALAVYELAVSLGERAHLSETQQTGFGLIVTAYNVEWAPSRFNPFLVAGKADRAIVRDTGRNTNRIIVDVDKIPRVPTQCIAVDSPDNTYLCTESMIVTHNTGSLTTDSSGAPRYWVKYPVQLAAYADAVPYDCDTDQRGVWPNPPHRKIALIYHYDLARALDGELVDWTAIPVDLQAGRVGGAAALAAKQFRPVFGDPIALAPPNKETTWNPSTTPNTNLDTTPIPTTKKPSASSEPPSSKPPSSDSATQPTPTIAPATTPGTNSKTTSATHSDLTSTATPVLGSSTASTTSPHASPSASPEAEPAPCSISTPTLAVTATSEPTTTTAPPTTTNETPTDTHSTPASGSASTTTTVASALMTATTIGGTPSAPASGLNSTTAGVAATDHSWILATQMLDWPTDTRTRLAAMWPHDTPTPGSVRRGDSTWTVDQLEIVRGLCGLVNAPWDTQPREGVNRWTTSTNSSHCSEQTSTTSVELSALSTGNTSNSAELSTGSSTPSINTPPSADDGDPLDPQALDALLAACTADDTRMIINQWLAESRNANCYWNPRIVGTVRSFEQARAARALATMWTDDDTADEFVRCILATATGRPT